MKDDLIERLESAASFCPWRAGQPAPLLREAAYELACLRDQAREAGWRYPDDHCERLNRVRAFIQDSLTNGHLSSGDVGNLMTARDEIDVLMLQAIRKPAPPAQEPKDEG